MHSFFFFQSSLCSPSSLGVSVVPFPLRSRASLTSERFRKGDRDHRGTERAQRAQRKADESMAKACLLLLPIFSVSSVLSLCLCGAVPSPKPLCYRSFASSSSIFDTFMFS